MAKKTETPKVPQHLLSDDESRKWKVVDIAVVSSTSVTALLQNNQEWCIDTFYYDEKEYQRRKRICLQTNLKEPPLLLSYVHVETKLKHLVCTKTKLHLIDDKSKSIDKSVSLSADPSALCVEDNKVYISTNETKTIMFFKLELPTDTSKIYLKDISKHDSIAEFVVHSKNIYVCTKGGKVSSHKETGEKQHDYRNRKSKNYKARGVAVFTPQGKDCNLLLVTWSDNTLYIYSTKNSHDLLDIDLNVPGKFRVTTSCFLMSSEVNDVAVYNMKTVADRGAFKMILVSSCREDDLSYLIDYVLHDTTAIVPLSRSFFIKRKNLTTLVEMYDYSCITNDNLNAEKKKLKDEIERSKKEKDDLTEELKNARSNLSRKESDLSNVKAKLDDARTESDELRIMNEEKEVKCCSLSKQLEAERKTTEELKDEIDRCKKEKDDLTKELENTISKLSTKAADLSDVKATLDDARTESDELRIMNEGKEEKCCSLTKQLEAERKATEELKHEIDRSKKEKDDLTEELENTRSNLSRKEADLSDVKVKLDDLKQEIDRSKKEKDDVTEELENTRSNLSRKEADLSDVKVKLDNAISESNNLREMNEEKEEKFRSLTKKLEAAKKATGEGGNTKDTVAPSTENIKTEILDLIDEIKDNTDELMQKRNDVMKELESTNSTLAKKEEDRLQIQNELDAAISKIKELEKTAEETDELKQIIEAKEKEIQRLQMRLKKAEKDVKNAKLQVTTLQEREKELVKLQGLLSNNIAKLEDANNRLKIEHDKAEKTQTLLSEAEKDVKNAKTQVTILQEREKELVKLQGLLSHNIAKLEDANNRLKIEHDKAEKKQTLLSEILENLDRDALILKTESEIVKEILQTKGKQQDMLVCLQSDFNSRFEILKKEEATLEYMMGQQNKIIDFEKKNRSALPNMVEQSSTNNDKQEVTAMGLEHKALPDNANTLDKEKMLQTLSLTKEEQINMIHNQTQSVTVNRAEILAPSQTLTGPMTKTPKENKKELVEKGSTEENVSKIHHDSNFIPLTPKRLPEDEQMLETRKEGVTEMTSFEAGTYSRLEQIQNFRVTKEKRQLSFIENKLQGVEDKVKYETFQYEYFKDMFESSDNLLGVLQQSTLLKTVDALVKEISNGKEKLGKLKDNRDNTVEEYEVQRDWFELHELQVSLVVSQDGGKLKIPGSDVSLDIPPGALQEQHEIQMTIIPHCLDPGGDSLSFSSNSSVVVELLPNKLQFQKTVHLRLPHCLHLNENYNSLRDVEVLISHHDKDDAPNWDVSTDTECKLEKDHCVIPLKKFCWITCRVDDKVVTAKRLKIFTAGRDLELSDRVSEVEVGYFPDLPGSGEILRKNPKLGRGQIKPFLFHKNEEGSTLQISLQQVIPREWQNKSSLGDKQIISYQSICTGTEMSCPFHLQYTPEGSPKGKVPLCLFNAFQENAEKIHITFRPEVKCDED